MIRHTFSVQNRLMFVISRCSSSSVFSNSRPTIRTRTMSARVAVDVVGSDLLDGPDSGGGWMAAAGDGTSLETYMSTRWCNSGGTWLTFLRESRTIRVKCAIWLFSSSFQPSSAPNCGSCRREVLAVVTKLRMSSSILRFRSICL